jgi:hypothetical protein
MSALALHRLSGRPLLVSGFFNPITKGQKGHDMRVIIAGSRGINVYAKVRDGSATSNRKAGLRLDGCGLIDKPEKQV